MTAKIIKLKPEDIKINKRRLERRVMQSSKKIPEWLNNEIEECLENCKHAPIGIYDFFDFKINQKSNTLKIKDKTFYSKSIIQRFKYAKEIGLFIVTVGQDSGDKAKKAHANNDGIKALIYDAIGSEYAESTADTIHEIIEKEKDYCMSRYSPGYNDWHVSEQKIFFELIHGKEIGVKLTETFFMQPEKSISAMIGYSDKNLKGCKNCSKTDCAYRKLTK